MGRSSPIPISLPLSLWASHRTTWRQSPLGSLAPPVPAALTPSTWLTGCFDLDENLKRIMARRAMMANRLVLALDKQSGTRPVGIGEVCRRLWAKCLLKAIGSQATAACGNFNLCAGLQAGIEGAVHAVRDVFADPSLIPAPPPDLMDPQDPLTQESVAPPAADVPTPPLPVPLADMTIDEAFAAIADDMGLSSAEASAVLLVNATSGFNELGRKVMLWTVRHRWATVPGLASTDTGTRPNSSCVGGAATAKSSSREERGSPKATPSL